MSNLHLNLSIHHGNISPSQSSKDPNPNLPVRRSQSRSRSPVYSSRSRDNTKLQSASHRSRSPVRRSQSRDDALPPEHKCTSWGHMSELLQEKSTSKSKSVQKSVKVKKEPRQDIQSETERKYFDIFLPQNQPKVEEDSDSSDGSFQC